MLKQGKKTTCLTVCTEIFDRYKKLCADKFSSVSREFALFMQKELEKGGENYVN